MAGGKGVVNGTALARISAKMKKIIEEEQARFEKEYGIRLSETQITEMLACKFGKYPLKNVRIQFKWKKKKRDGLAFL